MPDVTIRFSEGNNCGDVADPRGVPDPVWNPELGNLLTVSTANGSFSMERKFDATATTSKIGETVSGSASMSINFHPELWSLDLLYQLLPFR